jgi:hypothetical protein
VWKCIRRECDSFVHHLHYEIGDDSKVLFWHDVGVQWFYFWLRAKKYHT